MAGVLFQVDWDIQIILGHFLGGHHSWPDAPLGAVALPEHCMLLEAVSTGVSNPEHVTLWISLFAVMQDLCLAPFALSDCEAYE